MQETLGSIDNKGFSRSKNSCCRASNGHEGFVFRQLERVPLRSLLSHPSRLIASQPHGIRDLEYVPILLANAD